MTAFEFSRSALSSKENFPTGTATLPFLSSLNSTRPAFTSCTALAVSSVTVPVLGFRISLFGRFSRFTFREHEHTHLFPAAVWKRTRPTHHLIGLLRVDSKTK